MKHKTASQLIKELLKELDKQNGTGIGSVILMDQLIRSAKQYKKDIQSELEQNLDSRWIIHPQVLIDVYDIVLDKLENK